MFYITIFRAFKSTMHIIQLTLGVLEFCLGLCFSGYYYFYLSPCHKSLYSEHQTQVPESDQLWLLKLPESAEGKDRQTQLQDC